MYSCLPVKIFSQFFEFESKFLCLVEPQLAGSRQTSICFFWPLKYHEDLKLWGILTFYLDSNPISTTFIIVIIIIIIIIGSYHTKHVALQTNH